MRVKKDLEIVALNERIKQSFIHVEKSFKKMLDEIQESLEDLASESERFVGSGETFADQFGNKVTSLVSELKKPDKISFQDIETYINTLELFQRKIIYFGARWLRKIGPTHKFSIKQIERKRKQILNLTKDLKAHFTRHQDGLKKWKKAENIVRKMSKLEEERLVFRKTLEGVDSKLKELRNLIEEEEKGIQALGQKEDLVKAKEFKKDEESFEKSVITELGYLEKPVSKSIKLVENKFIVKDPQKIIELERFISNPKSELLDLEDVKTVEEALIYLQELLRGNKLNLKRSRNKKGIETISNILKRNKIQEYKRKFDSYNEQKRKLDDEGAMEKTAELEEIKKECQKKNEMLDNTIKEKKRIEEDMAAVEERIKESNAKLGELI